MLNYKRMEIVFLEPLGVPDYVMKNLQDDFVKKGHIFRHFSNRTEDENELIERTAMADVAVVSNIKLSKKYLRACPNLKFLQVAFTGFDHIDTDYCKKHGIAVSNASGYATISVAELSVSLALSLLKNTHEMETQLRNLKTRAGYLGNELAGKTVGIVGTGAIGLATARLFLAFGCRILAYSRTPKNFVSIEYVDLDTLMKNCDVISLHVPYNSETHHLINAQRLELCKNTAILINTARGLVVDNQVLAEALNNNRIAGAAIDVYEQEPPLPNNHPLLSANNTILLPHIAYATKQAMEKRLEIVHNSINAWVEGEQINTVV
jgi:D-3-phosphoglycerate dehydrogenase